MIQKIYWFLRNSCLQVFYKIDVLKSFLKFTGKHRVFQLKLQGIFYKTPRPTASDFFRRNKKSTKIIWIFFLKIFFPFFFKFANRRNKTKIHIIWSKHIYKHTKHTSGIHKQTPPSHHYILTICIPTSKFLCFIVADDL